MVDNRKKILFVIPSLDGGGAERVISHLANHIDRNTFIPEILLVKKSEHVYLNNLRDDIKVTKMDLNVRIRYSIFKTLKFINKSSPDVVFMGMSELNILVSIFIPFFKKYKWIARETNTISIRITNSFTRILYKFFYKKYHTIIAQCNDMKDDLIQNFNIPSQKIKIINNPIDTRFIDEKLKENTEVFLPKDKINLIACGRLTYQKGFDNLIEEFSKLRDRNKYHLTILGTSNKKDPENQKEILNNLVKKLALQNHVTFPGFQENSYKWFQRADIFILSSRYEGFPNVLLEALYCGTPALVNNCTGGINEIIIEEGNGVIFDFKKENFEEKLNLMLSIKFNEDAIKKSISSRYSLDKIIDMYKNVI